MKNNERYSDRDWEELASLLSGEKGEQTDLLGRFIADEGSETVKQWKELREMSEEKEINVDRAWNNVNARIMADDTATPARDTQIRFMGTTFLRAAAAVLLVLCLGAAATWLAGPDIFSRKITVATTNDQKNVEVALPDGSHVFLNRNSELTYRSGFGTRNRNVKLTGEAFFDVAHDVSKPFIIDAGEAKVRVVGTSFNVISSNNATEVEVFVKTGKVLVTGSSGAGSVDLEAGFIGTVGRSASSKKLNTNPNYMSWNTGLLVYNGQKLDVVFSDLKRVYDMDIKAGDPSILENTWTSPIDNQPQETIIRLICASFNLSYTREGNVYRLYKK